MKLGCSLIYEKAAYMTLCFVCIEDTFLVNCVVFDMYICVCLLSVMMMIGNMTTLTLSIILIITLMNCVFTTNKQQQNTNYSRLVSL